MQIQVTIVTIKFSELLKTIQEYLKFKLSLTKPDFLIHLQHKYRTYL